MNLQLVSEWKRLPIGHILVDYPDGAAELLIRRGIARVYADINADSRGSDGSNARTGYVDRGERSSKPVAKRRDA